MKLQQEYKAGRSSDLQRIRRRRSFQPTLERLDHRLALSGMTSSLISQVDPEAGLPIRVEAAIPIRNPYDNTSFVSDPAVSPAFSIHFNQQIDPLSLTLSDFNLFQIQADGSMKQIEQPGLRYLEDANDSDPTSSSLILSFISPLAPGEYRLFLSATGSLQNQFNVGTDGGDQLIEEFAVGDQAANSLPVNSLGSFTPSVTTTFLPVVNNDLRNPLNELNLPAGVNWTIAPSFGAADPDQYRIVLFDAQKQLILSTSGSNLLGLNQGIQSGRYYLQIYLTTSIEGMSNPTIPLIVTGKSKQPVGLATHQVTPFNLNGSDPNPDTLLIDLTGVEVTSAFFDTSKSAFTLVDRNGQSWPVKPSGYDATSDRMTLSLAGYLPSGHYTLSVATPGEAESVNLGSFDNVFRTLSPDNLGTIFPDVVDSNSRNPTEISPGRSVTQQFSVIETQRYQVTLSNPDVTGQLVQVTKDATGATSRIVIDLELGKTYSLKPGIYQIVAVNSTQITQRVYFAVIVNKVLPVSLSSGGVGQLPATPTQNTLVTNSPTLEVNEGSPQPNFPVAGDLQSLVVLRSAASTDLRTPQNTGGRSDTSVTFNSTVQLQVPLGSLSNTTGAIYATAIPARSSIISDSLASAVHSSVFLNPIASNVTPNRAVKSQSVPIESRSRMHSKQLAQIPDLLPSDQQMAVTPFVTDNVPELAQIDLKRSESTAIKTAKTSVSDQSNPAVVASNWMPTTQVELLDEPVSEPLEPSSELANLTSPISIIVASCVIVRQIKTTRIGAKLFRRQLFARSRRSVLEWFGLKQFGLGR